MFRLNKLLGSQRNNVVWKGGVPHLVAKAEMEEGGEIFGNGAIAVTQFRFLPQIFGGFFSH